jgi:hypothetical protein
MPNERTAGLRCKLRFFVPLALAALTLGLLSGCYSFGRETTWLRIQNMSLQPASFTARFYELNGDLAAEQTCPSQACPGLAPFAGVTLSSDDVPGLPGGFLGSIVVASDQPVAVLQGNDVERDGRFQSSADTMVSEASSGDRYLPIMAVHDGPGHDWNGRFFIQNLSDVVTPCVTLVYSSAASDAPVLYDPYDPAFAPPSRNPQCPNGGFPVPTGDSVYRQVDTMGVPEPFTGSVRILTHANAQGVPPAWQIALISAGMWNENAMDFGTYRAVTESELGTTVLLPLIERQAGGEWSTDFAIQNRDPAQPAQVTLRITGTAGGATVTKQNTFTVRASKLCFQDVPAADCLAPGDDLPAGFSNGRASITANRPLAVVVARTSSSSDSYANYRGVGAQDTSRGVFLPLVNKNSYSAERTGANSWVRVQVANGGTANLTISYFAPGLPGGFVTSTARITGAGNIVQASEPALPNGFVGSAVITSDTPIAAVVNVQAGDFAGDVDFMYTGVPT